MRMSYEELLDKVKTLEEENTRLNKQVQELVKAGVFTPMERAITAQETAKNIIDAVEHLITKHTEPQHYRGDHFVPATIDIGLIREFETLKKITLKCVNTDITI